MTVTIDPIQIGALSRLLDEGLTLAPQRRQRWLDGLPAWHQALKPRLQRLLARRRDDATAPTLALPRIGRSSDPPWTARPGQCVGPYRLLECIGSGGMAVVWSATASAPAAIDRRRLALKLPRSDQHDPDLIACLHDERDILASLAHPGIVRLHDAGCSADGTPYLALEYVHGRSITAWCRQWRPALAERVALFMQLLDAVRYLHESGVVHHDLKPANVLVDDHGRVRLLDFGIASRIAVPGPAASVPARARRRAFTPLYAAPEQAAGGAPGRPADLYALGVLLHELLTGARPAVVGAPQRPAVPAALQCIVALATAPRPGDRYQAVEALAHDLQRFLASTAARRGSIALEARAACLPPVAAQRRIGPVLPVRPADGSSCV